MKRCDARLRALSLGLLMVLQNSGVAQPVHRPHMTGQQLIHDIKADPRSGHNAIQRERAMKPTFQRLWQYFPRTESRAELYETLGWDHLIDHKAYMDTCAIRMSYALLRADVALPGAIIQVKAGPAKRRYIEHRQVALSRIRKRRWGAPEVYRSSNAQNGIAARRGVVSFFKVEGGNGEHIDLVVAGDHGFAVCARRCYFSAVSVWFWSLA